MRQSDLVLPRANGSELIEWENVVSSKSMGKNKCVKNCIKPYKIENDNIIEWRVCDKCCEKYNAKKGTSIEFDNTIIFGILSLRE